MDAPYGEPVPEVIPKTIEQRILFVKRRYLEYKHELLHGENGGVPLERARPIANELAVGDLHSLLGRNGVGPFRIQLQFEEFRRLELKDEVADHQSERVAP